MGETTQTYGAIRWAMLGVLCASLLLVAMDATILNVALPSLIDDLQVGPLEQLWIIDIYGLVLGGLLITTGALGDRVGRKLLFLGAVALGFLLLAVSPEPTTYPVVALVLVSSSHAFDVALTTTSYISAVVVAVVAVGTVWLVPRGFRVTGGH
ncbi:MFS transporter [Nocardia sp. A7]|uniref:MFS transporter n=1 Tax=Nocardia sp. A7 TaxID=2789274 RepID=UPI00397ADD33